MRDTINRFEYLRLVSAVKSGLAWDEVRGMLPGVDPVLLDKNFKETVLSDAGVVVAEAPAVEAPAVEEPPDEPPRPRKGK
jgi:hypothetical protein